MTAEIQQTEEFTKFREESRKEDFPDRGNFGLEGLDAVCCDFVSKKLEAGNTKIAFSWIENNTIL